MTDLLHVDVHVSPSIPTAITDLPPDLDVRVWSPIATRLIGSAIELYHAMRTRHPDRINPGALWGSARAAFPTETRT